MSRRAFWSWLAIIAGFILVGQQLGLIAVSFSALFWPSLLILWGVSRLSSNMQREFVLPEPDQKRTASLPANTDDTFTVPLAKETFKSDIQLAPIASAMTIQPGLEDGTLIIGRVSTAYARSVTQVNRTQKVHLSAERGDSGHWDFWLNPQIAHRLNLVLGTGRSQIDLSSLDITNLTLNRSSGSCTVLLPEAGDTRVQIEGGPGRLILITSPTAALSVNAPDSAELEIDTTRFPGGDGLYQSANWDRAASQVWIEIGAGSGKITIR